MLTLNWRLFTYHALRSLPVVRMSLTSNGYARSLKLPCVWPPALRHLVRRAQVTLHTARYARLVLKTGSWHDDPRNV